MRIPALLLAACLLLSRPVAAATTLTILTHYTEAQRAPLTACLQQYERLHPDIRIRQQQAEIDDYLQTVLIGRLSGTAPDIYNIYSVWSARLVQSGLLDPPPADVVRLLQSDYDASTVAAVSVDGRDWGIPTEVSTFMLLYNKILLRQAGIDAPPATWDELVADAARMTRRNAEGKITVAGFAFGPTMAASVYPFLTMLLSGGVTLFNTGLTGTHLSTQAATHVLTQQARLFMRGITDPTIQVRDFPSGAVAMMIFANWYKQTLQQAFGTALDRTVGVAPIPAGSGWRTLQYAFFWAVDAHSAHRAEAWDLLRWLNTAPHPGQPSCTGSMLGRLGALTSNRNDRAADPAEFADPFDMPFAQAIASGRAGAVPNVPAENEILDTLRLALGLTWHGHETPERALQAADRRIPAILNDRN